MRGLVLLQKGIVLAQTGRARDALATYAAAIVLFRRLGIKRHEAFALDDLGRALATLGRYEDAIRVTRASLYLDRETGDRLRLGRKLALLGLYEARRGDLPRSRAFSRRAAEVLDMFAHRDDAPARADALAALAQGELLRGEIASARTRLEELAQETSASAFVQAKVSLLRAVLDEADGADGGSV